MGVARRVMMQLAEKVKSKQATREPRGHRPLTSTSSMFIRRSPRLSAGYLHVLQALHGSHVLGAFECPRIRAADLAHAALHLVNGLIFVIFQPLPKTLF